LARQLGGGENGVGLAAEEDDLVANARRLTIDD
jgi:hypothetical protein